MACWLLYSQNSPVRQPAQSDTAASHPPPCTLKCSFSGSLAATDHTDCSHHSLQTKVTSQKSPLLLGTSRNTAPGHRTTEIHKPGVTFFYKVLGSSVKAGRESFPDSPSLCLGVLGYTGLAPYMLSCDLSVLLHSGTTAWVWAGPCSLQKPASPLPRRTETALLSAETQLSNADVYSL